MVGVRTRPISSTSRKPRVVIRPVFAPAFWRRALEPTVVPWSTDPTSDAGMPAVARSCAMPVSTASSGRAGVEDTFAL